MDPVVHVVMDVDVICDQNQLSGAESIEIRIFLTSKYGSRVLLAMYTAILLVCVANLIKKSHHNDKLLSTETTFGFSLLC